MFNTYVNKATSQLLTSYVPTLFRYILSFSIRYPDIYLMAYRPCIHCVFIITYNTIDNVCLPCIYLGMRMLVMLVYVSCYCLSFLPCSYEFLELHRAIVILLLNAIVAGKTLWLRKWISLYCHHIHVVIQAKQQLLILRTTSHICTRCSIWGFCHLVRHSAISQLNL